MLTPEMGVQALPTGVNGPLPEGTFRLLLGHSSLTWKGLVVAPGGIDADFTKEIKVMASSPFCITTIQSQQRIAQLLLIPYKQTGQVMSADARREGGFGSSDVYWDSEN